MATFPQVGLIGADLIGVDSDNPALDAETGLPNRYGFEAMLAMEERRSRRHGGNHSLVRVGLPDMAPSMTDVADSLATCLRDTDVLARIDYATFALLALHCDDSTVIVERLRAAMAELRVNIEVRVATAVSTELATEWLLLDCQPARP